MAPNGFEEERSLFFFKFLGDVKFERALAHEVDFCVHGQTLVCTAVAYRGEKRSRPSIHVR